MIKVYKMAKKVPPFHIRTTPAAIFDELWVLNPTTNEYEKLSNNGDDITVDWDDLAGKPAVIAAGATQQDARDVIGAGTSNLALGTTSTTAKAGNYHPTWNQVTNKPAVIAAGDDQASARLAIGAGTSDLKIGATATDAMAGNTAIPSGADLVPAAGADGLVLKVVGGTPAWATDNNTTYTAMTAAVATAGTSTTANTINALVLAGAIDERLSVLSNEIAALAGRVAALEGGE